MTAVAFWNPDHVPISVENEEKKIVFPYQGWKADCILKGTGGLSMDVSWRFAAGMGKMSARNFWDNVTIFQYLFCKERMIIKGSVRNHPTVRQWQQLNSLDHLLRLSGRAVGLHFKCKESLALNRAIMAEAVCVINRKAARMQLVPRCFPSPLPIIANWKKVGIAWWSECIRHNSFCHAERLQHTPGDARQASGFHVSNPGWLVVLSGDLFILWKPSNLFSLVNKKISLLFH